MTRIYKIAQSEYHSNKYSIVFGNATKKIAETIIILNNIKFNITNSLPQYFIVFIVRPKDIIY